MRSIIAIFTLLFGIGLMLTGNGLIGTLLGVRGGIEGFSSSVLGMIMAGYFTGFVTGTFIVPRLIRVAGYVRTFAALASICSVTVLLHGLYPDPLVWFVARAAAGICIVGIYIIIESWLNEQTTNEQRGHIFSAYMTTTFVGLGIGQLLLQAGDVNTLQLFALGSVLMSIGLVPVAFTRVQEPPLVEAHRLGLRKLYEGSPLGVVGALFSGVGTGAFWGLAPVMAAGIGLNPAGISGFMALSILGGALVMWPIGHLSDRLDRRKVLAWVCLMTGIAALGALWLITWDPRLILVAGFLYGATAFSIYSLSAAHTNDHIGTEHMLEATSSLQLLYGSGAIAGPLTAGFLMQWIGPTILLGFMGGAALVPAGFAFWRMWVRPPVSRDNQGEWVPQFATSPAALEMLPDQEDETKTTGEDIEAGPREDAKPQAKS
ncbi:MULTISPECIES: MFS transporter [unclassified Wenzhouxiangella]|uniref:MFS transporter n=1 Tax=unclassified Wenzhouxiangella TaxID=2613841 RepID=UPI000E32C47B|nr:MULTISPECIES: MFS transporter [unclassified Wenzhouxiangella]RFF27315.1 MFS transporter [Wenzhouxiangella sp. 15181]RFP68748.1 MFS transporter [Wenzhouxiangella sp. 15190]